MRRPGLVADAIHALFWLHCAAIESGGIIRTHFRECRRNTIPSLHNTAGLPREASRECPANFREKHLLSGPLDQPLRLGPTQRYLHFFLGWNRVINSIRNSLNVAKSHPITIRSRRCCVKDPRVCLGFGHFQAELKFPCFVNAPIAAKSSPEVKPRMRRLSGHTSDRFLPAFPQTKTRTT